jgi:hypothetical protein
MASWLFPIIGIVVVGVLVELASGDTKMGKFVRSVYSFIILFVIVQPIPKLLNEKIGFFENDGMVTVNAELLEEIQNGSHEAQATRVKNLLADLGYGDCLVYVDGDGVYINSAWHLYTSDIIKIKQVVATALGIDVMEVNIT